MPIPTIPYIQYNEKLVGENHPLFLADTINRPIRQLVDYLQSGESDIPVARLNIKVDSISDIAFDVVNDDVVWFNPSTMKFERAFDEMTGIIDIDNLIVYTYGMYDLKQTSTLIKGEKYYLDTTVPGKLTLTEGKLVGVAYGTSKILNLALYNLGLENKNEKGKANGYASLDGSGLVPSSQLPSYVDDVLEFATLASFPVTGESGKIYVDTSNSKTYRWSGSTYILISADDGNALAFAIALG